MGLLSRPLRERVRLLLYDRGFHVRRSRFCKLFADSANYHDIDPTARETVIFDVGANVGDTAYTFRHFFPNAVIHAFEPMPAPYEFLANRLRSVRPVIHCHQLALSNAAGTLTVSHDNKPFTTIGSIEEPTGSHEATIDVDTVDQFCEKHDIHQVDILKIDTEGHDMSVLEGAEALLKSGQIRNVIVETVLGDAINSAIGFAEFEKYFLSHGLELHSIYDVNHLQRDGKLQYFNAMFRCGR